MDDFSLSSLSEGRNEWCSRLITTLTPLIVDGYKSILEEAVDICRKNNQTDKYLMTFQNFVSRIPKWNNTIIDNETKRIIDKSGCNYLEDLITCVHIIQLKMLTTMRVGQKQKKIDINIPKINDFIHKVYINVARKVYTNVYLFELYIPPLNIQKNNRELEMIIRENILNTIRDSIPVETVLQVYLNDIEDFTVEEINDQVLEEPDNDIKEQQSQINTDNNLNNISINKVNDEPKRPVDDKPIITTNDKPIIPAHNVSLKFDDVDYIKDIDDNVTSVIAPKTVERLQEISIERNKINQISSYDDDDDDDGKIRISNEDIGLGELNIHSFDEPDTIQMLPDLQLEDVDF